jgi:protease-4
MEEFPQASPAPRPPASPLLRAGGGFARALGFAAGLFVLAAVFFAGLGFGAILVLAGSQESPPVVSTTYRDGGRNTVAILPVTGVIDEYQARVFRLLADHVLGDLGTYKAVVLRVDSPGGGVSASDRIWYEVKRLRDAGLPVVSSFGGLAASGGYYVSCATDRIVAEPTCITGSIGVIAQTFIVQDLMDWAGIEPVTLLATDSPQKDLGNPFRAWNDRDREKFVALLDGAYAIFNQRVREGRARAIPDAARVNELANGSVFMAEAALGNGLVDAIGYLDDAVADAEKLAGLGTGTATVVRLGERWTLFGSLFGASAPGARSASVLEDPQRLRTLIDDFTSTRLMYLLR